MTANGYVRCGGCGGFLPAGAICGYCLQQQQMAQSRMVTPTPAAKPARPGRVLAMIAVCAIAVCGVGLAAVFAARGAIHSANLTRQGPGSSALAGLDASGNGGESTLASGSNNKLIAALNSGDTQQALSVLQSAPAPTPPVTQSTSTPAPAITPSTTSQAPITESAAGMPDNVRRWLEHLQKIEQARISLSAGQLQDAVKTLAGLQAGDMTHALDDEGNDSKEAEQRKQNDRAQHVGGDMASMQQAWRTLLNAFDSVQAPAECAAIKTNYDQVIGQTGTMILNIVGQIKNASNDPQAALSALTAMQGQSKTKIDVPARAADQGVSSVCKHYDTVKWFDIQSDVGSGVMSQLGL